MVKTALARKGLLLDDSCSFFYVDQLIGGSIFEGVHSAAGPADFNQIRLPCFTESKVNTQIILGKIAATAAPLINLLHGVFRLRRVAHTFNSRTDPAAV